MNKQDFINITELEQVGFINTELLEKKTKIIAEEMGVSQSWLSKHLRDMGYIYKQGQYIKVEEIATGSNFLNDLDIPKEDFKRAILWAVKESKNGKSPIEIDTEYITGEKPKSRTFLVSGEILEMWDQFCKENIIYQNQHLFSMALLEYIEKHS